MLEVRLLGKFEVRVDGERVEIPSRPAQTLLAYMILHAGTQQRREKLAGMLWPDSTESNARRNLRSALWRLRKALGDAYFLSDKVSVAFDPNSVYKLDVSTLEREAGDQGSSSQLIDTVSVYEGTLLPGFYDDWVTLERERLQAVFEDRMQVLMDRLIEEQRWRDVRQWAERWIAQGQAPEQAFRALMAAHAGMGDLSGVAATYQRCVDSLSEELGGDPSEETRQLYQRLAKGERPPLAGVQPVRREATVAKPHGRITEEAERSCPHDLPSQPPAFLDEAGEPREASKEIFIGRERELSLLDEFLGRALGGRGQVAFVVGEAGSGKTSLLNEFARRAQAAHSDLVVASGICDAHIGVGDPYLPFRELLGMLTGEVEARWAAGTITREHALRLWRLFPEALEVLVDHGPNLVDTFVQGRALETRAAAFTAEGLSGLNRLQELLARRAVLTETLAPNQGRIFKEYTYLLEALSARQPLMLIIDNLHWADVSSISLFLHLSQTVDERRILIMGAYRPEDVAHGRDGKQHPLDDMLSELKRHYGETWVDLDSSGPTVARAFVDALLDEESNQLEERFRREMTRIAGGHPLFTVELLRDLRERGDLFQDEKGRWVARPNLVWNELPPRVEGVIERRIGRLDPELRETLAVASVEGEDFTAEVVARVQGMDERELVRQLSVELDRRHRIVRAQGIRRLGSRRVSNYRFRHHLFQRFLYDSLDPVERAYQHEAVGNGLEALYESDTEEIAVQLARHYREAGLADKSIGYLLQAGERAFRLSANEEAIAHLNEGLDLLKTLPDTPDRAQLELALQIALGVAFKVTRGRSAPEVGAAFARARELCEQFGDPSQLFMVLWNLWLSTEGEADWETVRELADELMSLARQVGEPALVLQALHTHWAMSLWTAEFSLAYEYTQQGIALYEPEQHHALAFHYAGHDPGVCCLISSAEALWLLGMPDQALERSQEALNLALELSHPHSLAFTQTFASQIRVFRRESREARQLAESALSLSAEQGFPDYFGEATIFRGWALAKQGQVEAGIEEMLQGTDPERALPHDVERPYFLSLLAEIHWQEGRSAEGLKILAEALRPTKKRKAHYWDAEMQRLKGEMLLSQGMDQAAVEQHYQRAIEVARRQGAKLLELRATMSLSRLLQQQGKRDEARRVLGEIYSWFTEGSDTKDLKEAKALLESLL